MLDVTMDIHPRDKAVRMSFQIDPHELAKAISMDEARLLVSEIADQLGMKPFADVAESVIDEYGVTEE